MQQSTGVLDTQAMTRTLLEAEDLRERYEYMSACQSNDRAWVAAAWVYLELLEILPDVTEDEFAHGQIVRGEIARRANIVGRTGPDLASPTGHDPLAPVDIFRGYGMGIVEAHEHNKRLSAISCTPAIPADPQTACGDTTDTQDNQRFIDDC